MSKRVQIPVSESEERLFKTAAKKKGLPLAEWARDLLKEKAAIEMGPENMTPKAALKAISEINASVDSVEIMIEQSFKSRYK